MVTLRIELNDELVHEIEKLASQAGQDREEFIANALRRQVDLTRGAYSSRMTPESFEAVRERLRPYAEEADYTREGEILDDIS